jgi:hypothetical protein
VLGVVGVPATGDDFYVSLWDVLYVLLSPLAPNPCGCWTNCLLCVYQLCVGVGACMKRADEIIRGDRRVTLDTGATKLGIGHSAVQETTGGSRHRKICARLGTTFTD